MDSFISEAKIKINTLRLESLDTKTTPPMPIPTAHSQPSTNLFTVQLSNLSAKLLEMPNRYLAKPRHASNSAPPLYALDMNNQAPTKHSH